MATVQAENRVDVAPFAARQAWTTPHDYEVWWEDPRDVYRVVVRVAPGVVPGPQEVGAGNPMSDVADGYIGPSAPSAYTRLEYWQQSWPKVRVPKGADVGSGRQGWLAIDDWTNGRWQKADCEVEREGHGWSYTFRPLNLQEFPDEQGFPATFRRTLGLRLHVEQPGVHVEALQAYTDSEWREAQVVVEWKSLTGEPVTWDGHLEVFNGEPLAVKPLTPGVEVLDVAAWRSAVEKMATGGIVATIRYAANEDANSYDRSIVTVRSQAHSFSFAMDEALAGEPIYVRDLGVVVSQAGAGVRLAGLEAAWEKNHQKTLYQRVGELPEQTWERAWADMPRKRQFYFVLGCEGSRQKFGVDPSGDVFLRENYIRRVPGKDTPRLGWEGGELRYRFGFPAVPPGDRSLLDGYLPVIRAAWVDGDLCYEQEAYATWLIPAPSPSQGEGRGEGAPSSSQGEGRGEGGGEGAPSPSQGEGRGEGGGEGAPSPSQGEGRGEGRGEGAPSPSQGEGRGEGGGEGAPSPSQGEGRGEGDDPVVAMIQVRIANLGDEPKTAHLYLTSVIDQGTAEQLAEQGGRVLAGDRLRYLLDVNGAGALRAQDGGLAYQVTLPAKASHTLWIKIPFIALTQPDEIARLRALPYAAEKKRVAEFWRRRIAQGAQIETPNETLNNFYRTHLMHMLVINDREPGADRNVARCGGFHYGSFPDEGCMVISDLDRRGYTQEAERCLQLYLDYQGTVPLPGNYQSTDGVFYGSGGYEEAGYNRNQGWVLWCLAEHYRYTRDRAWLERVAPALVKGCDWIVRERQGTMENHVLPLRLPKRDVSYGFLPSGSLEDVTDYWTWLSTNAYAYLGFRSAAEVLAEIGHPAAARLQREAQAYGQDLRAGFFEACVRSPVVRLRDGTWVPHFPPRQERRGRDFGWLREVLEGAAHLVYCGIVAPDEPAARWIIEDYEDNLFLSERYGYPAPDFERQWFSWGGFSMQPNLLLLPPLYLWRDEPEHFLRAYLNPFAAAFYPDTLMLTEHPLPTLADWLGDHFKSSDEANSTCWLRLMFLAERGDELFVGQALPRAWFEDGKRMRVQRALTHFGETSLEIVSQVATGHVVVNLDPPRRNPPRRIRLRVRHPQRKPIQAVWVNGQPQSRFDVEREVIDLEGWTEPVQVRVKY